MNMPKLMDTNDHRAVESEGERSPMQVQGLLECAAEFVALTERHADQAAADVEFTRAELLCVLSALGDQQKLTRNDTSYSRDNLGALEKTHALLGAK